MAWFKRILIALLAIVVIIQFIRPEKNQSDVHPNALAAKYEVPHEVDLILKVACNDCHSNRSGYPWYAEIQPVGWWLNNHIEDGKRHLNLSDFTSRPIASQNHKFEEIVETVEEEEMPLPSYTYLGLHAEANLSPEQRETLIRWAKDQMQVLAATYPADSLVFRRRRPASAEGETPGS